MNDKISEIIDNLLNQRNNNYNNNNNANNSINPHINNINNTKENQPAPIPEIQLPDPAIKPTEQPKSVSFFNFNDSHHHTLSRSSHKESITTKTKEDIYNNNKVEIKEQKISVYDKIFFFMHQKLILIQK